MTEKRCKVCGRPEHVGFAFDDGCEAFAEDGRRSILRPRLREQAV